MANIYHLAKMELVALRSQLTQSLEKAHRLEAALVTLENQADDSTQMRAFIEAKGLDSDFAEWAGEE